MLEFEKIESKIIRRIIDRLPDEELTGDFLNKIPDNFYSDKPTSIEFNNTLRQVLNFYFENEPDLQDAAFLFPTIPDKIYEPSMLFPGVNFVRDKDSLFITNFFYEALIRALGVKLINSITKEYPNNSKAYKIQQFAYSPFRVLRDIDGCLEKTNNILQDCHGEPMVGLNFSLDTTIQIALDTTIQTLKSNDKIFRCHIIGELLLWIRTELAELYSMMYNFRDIPPNVIELHEIYPFGYSKFDFGEYWGDLNERVIRMSLDKYNKYDTTQPFIGLIHNCRKKQKMFENISVPDNHKTIFSNRTNKQIEALENYIYLKVFSPNSVIESFEQLTDERHIGPIVKSSFKEINANMKNLPSESDQHYFLEREVRKIEDAYDYFNIRDEGSGKSIYSKIKGYIISLETSFTLNQKLNTEVETKSLTVHSKRLSKEERLPKLISCLSSQLNLVEPDQNKELFDLIMNKDCKKVKRKKIYINCGPTAYAIIAENFKYSEWGGFSYTDIESSNLFISTKKKTKGNKPEDRIITASDISTPLERVKKKHRDGPGHHPLKKKIDDIFKQWQ